MRVEVRLVSSPHRWMVAALLGLAWMRPVIADPAPPSRPLFSADMPGKSHQGPLPPLTAAQRQLAASLRQDVTHLAVTIGERNVVRYSQLELARQWVQEQWTRAGFSVQAQSYSADQHKFANLECTITGDSPEVVVVGAHYDSAKGCPGANDNGSGVAALLALSRRLRAHPGKLQRSLRFVAFTNEEPGYFVSESMGSLVYARHCRQRGDQIRAMVSLETIGCYSDAPNSQHYPAPLGLSYPGTGNFIAFVGNVESATLVKSCVASFRQRTRFPSEGAALPAQLEGVGWSDHWSFWQIGVEALMVTDTAPFRYPHYHRPGDTPDKMDFERMARVVEGLEGVILDLTKKPR